MVDTKTEPTPQAGQTDVTPPAQPDGDGWSDAQTEFDKEPTTDDSQTNADGKNPEPTATGDGQPKDGQPVVVDGDGKEGQPAGDDATAADGVVAKVDDDDDAGNWYDVEDVPGLENATPEQKSVWKKHLRKVQGKERKRYQAVVEHGKAFQGAWQKQMAAFAQVAKAPPEKRLEIVNALLQENAPVLKKFGVEFAQNATKETELPPEIDELTTSIAQADTAEKAAELMKKRDAIMFKFMRSQISSAVNQVKEEGVKAARGVVAPIEEQARKNEKVVGWSGAIEAMKIGGNGKQPIADLENYMPKIVEFIYGNKEKNISADPELKTLVLLLNENPQRAHEMGLTRESILRRAYKNVSYDDRLKAAKKEGSEELRKQLSESGEMPGRYVPSKSDEGQDWDELEKDYRAQA